MEKMFFNNQKRQKEAMELDITSLLDVLVILLVFLLKSYNASDLKLNLVDNLTLPDSEQRKLGSHQITLQVDKQKQVWVDNKLIGEINNSETVAELQGVLKDNEAKIVNLVFDQELPYQTIAKIMNTSSVAGKSQFKFIVKGNF